MSVEIFVGKKPSNKREPKEHLNSRIDICEICDQPFMNTKPHQTGNRLEEGKTLRACTKKECQVEVNRRRARLRYRRKNGVAETAFLVKDKLRGKAPEPMKPRELMPQKSRLVMAVVPGAL